VFRLLYIYYTLYHTIILYYTLLFFSSFFSSSIFLIYPLLIYLPLIFPSHPLLFFSSQYPPNIHSILVGTYIYLFIFQTHLPLIHSILVGTYIYLFIFPILFSFPTILTPHKLSEGCLEWCSFISIWFWFMF
jgi:hypothetical protein